MYLSPRLTSPALQSAAAFMLAAAVVVGSSIFGPVSSQGRSDIIVKYDQSQILRLPRPVADIIIGNPTIADVTVQAPDLLVITGKTFGITNVIFLDAAKKIIQEQRVMVIRDQASVVNLTKGEKRSSFNCTPQCNPMAVVGDDPSYFESVTKTAERKIKFSESGGESANPSNGSN
jgi:hypothetical protein